MTEGNLTVEEIIMYLLNDGYVNCTEVRKGFHISPKDGGFDIVVYKNGLGCESLIISEGDEADARFDFLESGTITEGEDIFDESFLENGLKVL